MGFAVLHIEKGTAGKAGGLGNHIDRKINVPNADPERIHMNYTLVKDDGKLKLKSVKEANKESLQSRINERVKQGYKGKRAIRKDAVTHLNIILTGSHEEMTKLAETSHLADWLKDNYAFVVNKYGKENVVDFTIHNDERTPHIHCVVVPLTSDGRLSAKEVMGDRNKMSDLQTEYAKAMQKYNLKRGIKGSKATHDSVREYYGRINERLDHYERYKVDSISENYVDVPQIEEIPPLMNREKWLERQNEAISESFGRKIEQLKSDYKKNIERAENRGLQNEVALEKLRQEKSKLMALLVQKDKKLHPERYTKKIQQQQKGKGIKM